MTGTAAVVGTMIVTTDAFTPSQVPFAYAQPIVPSIGDPALSDLTNSGVAFGTVASAASNLTAFNLGGNSVGFGYNISAAGNYAGAQFHLNTRWNLTSAPLVFSVQNTAGSGTAISTVKAVLKDASGKTAVVMLTGVTGADQKFTITSADVIASAGAGNFDTSNVASVTFIVDKDIVTGTAAVTGTVTIAGLNLPAANLPAGMVWQASAGSGPATNLSTFGVLPTTFASAAAALSASARTATGFSFSYYAIGTNDYAGAALQFGSSYDLSQPLVLGVKNTAATTTTNKSLKVMAKDAQGRTAIVEFSGILTTERFITLTAVDFTAAAGGSGNFDAQHVTSLFLFVDKDTVSGNGTVYVTNPGLACQSAGSLPATATDVILSTSGTVSNLLNFSASPQGLGALPSNLTSFSAAASSVTFSYNTQNLDAQTAEYAGVRLNLGTSWNLNSPADAVSPGNGDLVLKVRRTAGTAGSIKVIVTNASGQKVALNFTGITTLDKYIKITKDPLLTNFGNIVAVDFLVDEAVTPGTGTIVITTSNLAMPSAVDIPVGLARSVAAATGTVSTLAGVIPRTVASGTGVLTAFSATPTTVALGYNIASAGQYAGAKFAARRVPPGT
ncbi:MAG: hypothetical protein WCK89_10970 [bacterium]